MNSGRVDHEKLHGSELRTEERPLLLVLGLGWQDELSLESVELLYAEAKMGLGWLGRRRWRDAGDRALAFHDVVGAGSLDGVPHLQRRGHLVVLFFFFDVVEDWPSEIQSGELLRGHWLRIVHVRSNTVD